MANRYLVPILPTCGPLRLDGDLAHHLGRVLRSRPGDPIVLGDGLGGTATAVVRTVSKQHIDCEVTAVGRIEAPCPHVVLAFAPPQPQRTDWLLEHGTEVGVGSFQPVWTERTRPQGDRTERWQKIIRAAAGQCDRAWLPDLLPPLELSAWLQTPTLPPARVLADANGTPIANRGATDRTALLIGPEGGFSADELAEIARAGFTPHTLGPHILRTETAALVGAAMLVGSRTQ